MLEELLILVAGLATGFCLHSQIAQVRRKRQLPKDSTGAAEELNKLPYADIALEKNSSSDYFSEIELNQKGLKNFDASDLIRHAACQDSFFNMVLGMIPCQVFIKDSQDGFRYKIANRNFIEYYQLEEKKVIEHPDEDIFDPEVARELRRHDKEVCATPGKVFRYDEDISFRRRGREIFKSLKVCFETNDHHRYLLGICVDVTDLNKMIQRERINNEALSQAVTESDFQNIVGKMARTLKEELGCSRVVYLNYSPEEELNLFYEEYDSELSSIKDSGLKNHEMFWNSHLDRLHDSNLIMYEDLSKVSEAAEILCQYSNYSIKSLAAVPIFVEGKLLGALLVSYSAPHVFSEMDKDFLYSVSRIVSLVAIRDRQSYYMQRTERENQALLDNISIPLWLYNSSGCIIKTNNAADRILGTPEKKIPFSCQKLLHCEEQCELCIVRKVFENNKTAHKKCWYQNKSYLIEANPISESETGTIRGVVSSFYDVTELEDLISSRQIINDCLTNLVREDDMRQAMQKSIREICEHLGASRCYIVQFNTQAKTVSCFLEYSPGFEPISDHIQNHPYSTEKKWEEYFMEHPVIYFPNQESILTEKGLASYYENFIKFNVQSIYVHRILLNGKLWGYVSAMYEHVPHVLSDSEKDFFSSIAYCIELMVVRQQYQNRILAALRQAENADRAKSMFLASISHEIRTPLNAVIGFSELLKDGSLPQKTKSDYLNAISESGSALLALINDVLDLSKLEAGQMVFNLSEVDFTDLVREVGNIFLSKCRERKLYFKIDIVKDLPLVKIDKLRVRQILFNLVGNAVKFTENGSITVKVEFDKVSEEKGTLRFSIIDTGIGITEEDQKRIFQMFVQAQAVRGTQAEKNGTGLGLAICKQMIEKMDGELLLKSEIGKGSEFSVLLHEVSWSELKLEEVPPLQEDKEFKLLESKNILVVDDVVLNLKVISAMLTVMNQRVLIAHNAKEALNLLEKNPVDFLLTDLWMPGMNGAVLANKIRQSGKYPNLIIVAVTADVEGDSNFDMSAFDRVLTKPIAPDKLKNIISCSTQKNE